MIRTYFFDFDGTLVDSSPLQAWAFREITKTEFHDALASVTDPIERQSALQACQGVSA